MKYDSDTPKLPQLSEQKITEIKELYEQAISKGKVNRELYTYEAFQENYQLNQTTYSEMKELFGDYSSYDDWFGDIMNYGAFPDGEGHSPSEKTRVPRATKQQNAERFKRDIRKGDIIIVNSGGFGHAAIATSDNYILEITGGAAGPKFTNWFGKGISDNNHQFSKHNWLWRGKEQGFQKKDAMIDSYLQIWRIPNKNMANQCGTYADKTFWNSSCGYKKNRHYNYLIDHKIYNKNPTYCSKMVFHAFYYGSGNSPVMVEPTVNNNNWLDFVAPGSLPNLFQKGYKP